MFASFAVMFQGFSRWVENSSRFAGTDNLHAPAWQENTSQVLFMNHHHDNGDSVIFVF